MVFDIREGVKYFGVPPSPLQTEWSPENIKYFAVTIYFNLIFDMNSFRDSCSVILLDFGTFNACLSLTALRACSNNRGNTEDLATGMYGQYSGQIGSFYGQADRKG